MLFKRVTGFEPGLNLVDLNLRFRFKVQGVGEQTWRCGFKVQANVPEPELNRTLARLFSTVH